MFGQMRTRTPKMILATGVGTLITLTLLAGSAVATPVGTSLDFAGGTGGSVSYTAGLGNSLSVTNAPIATVQQVPSSIFYAIVGGLLDLTTGGCATGCSINPVTHNANPFFNDGGSISITGSIPSLSGDPSGTLISGFWDSTLSEQSLGHKICPVTNATLNPTTGGVGMQGCVRVTFINQTLLQDLNFPSGITGGDGFLSQLFLDVSLSDGTFSGEIKHSDMRVKPLPEPATLALLGAGLLFLGNLGRKKLQSKVAAR